MLFVGLSETWLQSHNEAELSIDGYTPFHCDTVRKRKGGGRLTGGVAFYVRNDLASSCEVIFSHSSESVQLMCLYSKSENLALLAIYRQPDDKYHGHPSTPTDFLTPINRVKTLLGSISPMPDIVFGGDFNLPNVIWPQGAPAPGCTPDERIMLNGLNEFCNDLFMSQHVLFPTHKDGNTLDLVFTNNANLIHDCVPVPVLQSTSHHSIVMVSTTYKVKVLLEDEEQRPPLTKFNALNFFHNDIDWNKLEEHINNIDWHNELATDDPNKILDNIYSLTHSQCVDEVPVKTKLEAKSLSKVLRYRLKLTRRRRKITKRLIAVKSQTTKAKINCELLQIEKDLQKSFKNSHSFMEQKAVDAIKSNPKYFFSYVQMKSKVKTKIGPLFNSEGKLTAKSKDMAEILSQQYVNVFSKPSEDQEANNNANTNSKSIPPLQISEENITKAIDELSPTSAAGPDGFPAILLKNCKTALATPLVILWTKSLEKGVVPELLKKSIITPIHKGGSRSTAANYRPISLTSHIIKIFEKIMRQHIVNYMNDNSLFNASQHGFRAGRSCLSQLLEQFDIILDILDTGANADVVYLDFAKAFDKVDHKIVLSKIMKIGINGKIYEWIQSFLMNRYQSVMVNGITSDPQEVLSGVPQGSVLGPLIFLIMIGDINNEVKHSIVKSFADDTRATKSIASLDDVQRFQSDLQVIYSWTASNNKELNDVKFELLRYGPNESIKSNTEYLTPQGNTITTKEVVKDLGVLMSNDCLFKQQINAVTEKAKNIISWILRTFKSREYDAMITLYRSLVIPILEYCSVLWSPSSVGLIQQLESIQWSFLRKIRGINYSNYWECLKQMKMYSLERRRERYRIIYTWKILENLVPNVNGKVQSKNHIRLGRVCINNFSNSMTQKLRDGSITIDGPRLFNTLPKHIRDLTDISVAKFKRAIDKHLASIPDEPGLPGYTACRRTNSNSLTEM